MAKNFVANVKAVLSGDTLILTSPSNPTLERTFSLAFVSAPRLSKDSEEPFAFQSREQLRQLVLGKQVQCSILYTVPSSKRDYGTVQIKDGPKLPDFLVDAGWLKVREDAGKKEENEETVQRIENLRAAETKARTSNLGIFSGQNGRIEVQHDIGGPEFFKEWKGKTVDGIVERVFTGDRLLVRLLFSETKHYQVMTLIAGIRTPATERTSQTGQIQQAEEYGKEAHLFVEQRLHQRLVKVQIIGASPQGQLVATILHPRGNIAVFLLDEGLARCNDFHSTMLGEGMLALRAAEKRAQAGKKHLHKNHVVTTTGGNLDVTVTKVIGADTIMVRDKSGQEKRVQLSSIRGPRVNEASESAFREEAKEFLRKKLIGKHAHMTVDGSRVASEGFEAKDVATITQNGKNINLIIIQEGYGSVIRHRKDDTDRAPNYDELLAAQETAKEEKKGMWSGKAPKLKQYIDASENLQRAKIQVAALQRQKRVPGVIDFCKSGSRFTVLLPREGIKLTLVLAGIRAPRAPGRNSQEKAEPFGEEALELANRRCNQRDCEINVLDVDKIGGFIGELFINRESFAKILVEEGLASVHQYSAEKSGNATELNAAEKRAKEARKGLWHDWDPSQDEIAESDDAEVTAGSTGGDGATISQLPQDYRDIVVTNIDANGRLKIQEIGKGTASLETLMTEFRKFNLDSKNNVSIGPSPKAGDFVSAKFSEDGQWYRAKIRANDRTAKVAEVVYIDYGNSEKKPWSQLRPLDMSKFGPLRLKAQAVDAVLSFVQLPTGSDYFRDAVNFIAECTTEPLVGSFDFVDTKEGLSYITIFDPKAGSSRNASLNREVLLNGHGLVPRKLKNWERSPVFESTLNALRDAEKEAKENKYGMWEYGDITED
ncbi:hypothetical protein SEPCBS119000_004039 [Sporothrix epigloea]|uniref:Probable endonuclease LCL3 n=1 Tax=Sporothrix epigloea TaxID=1892477 RepID=A0ABP0DQ07_9PEZI